MSQLLQVAAKSVTFYGKSYFGYRAYGMDDGFWIKVYPIPSEIYGGSEDGKRVVYRFRMELSLLVREFDAMPSVTWETDQGEIVFHGRVHGNDVVLRIMEHAPDDQPPDEIIDTIRGGTRSPER